MDPSSVVDPLNVFSAKGLVVAITGGGSGIGLAMTASIFKTGARKVYILGRRLDVLNAAVRSVDPNNTMGGVGVIVPVQADITSSESIAAAVQQIKADVGYLDVLINNAGLLGPEDKHAQEAKTIEDVQRTLLASFEGGQWDATLKTNTTSVVAVSAAFLVLLARGNERRGWQSGRVAPDATRQRDPGVAQGNGVEADDLRTSQIITVSSIASFNRHLTAGLAYAASKAAATHLGKTLATLLRPWGIRSNVIAPGIYPSAMTGESDAVYPVGQIPAGRKGNFDDIAGVTLYLVGKGGAYVNGNVQITDGGRLSGFPATY